MAKHPRGQYLQPPT